MLRTILLIGTLTAAIVAGPASGPRDEASLRNKFPRAFIHLPEGSHGIVVEKSTQSLILYEGTGEGLPRFTQVVKANTGERDGDKVAEGDLRTPEGIYFFTRTIEGRQLPPEYGIRAFVTDFPNVFDRIMGKNGSNIWLHATNEPDRVTDGYNTKGCVVVTNDDMLAITPMIRTGYQVNATALVVEEELDLLEPTAASRLNEELRDLMARWEEAWESMNVDRYISFYSRDFVSGARDRDAWKAYKERLTRQYAYIQVEIEDLHLFSHQGELVATFRQHYTSDRFDARSEKRLYFRREEGGWMIVRENSRSSG